MVATAEDGTFGLGFTNHGEPVGEIVNGHFGPLLRGQDCVATEKLWDMMRRASAPYGSAGLASYAISAVDIALWDLKGKLLKRPVYELLGGPAEGAHPLLRQQHGPLVRDEDSIAWFLELGFKAVKLFLRSGAEGRRSSGCGGAEELVAQTREQVGPDVEMMVDAWLSLNVEHAVRLGEALRPYRVKWLEDYLLPEDLEGYARVRDRLPGITWRGEHWYTLHPFAAAGRGAGGHPAAGPGVVRGISAGQRICHLAEAHGLTVIAHGGMNYPWGQHLSLAMPAIPMGERSEGVTPPGVPLEEMVTAAGDGADQGWLGAPSDAPGLGMEITREWLEARTV